MNTYAPLPVGFTHGNGPWVFDGQGQRYLDALGGLAVTFLGHNHPAVTQAITAQASQLLHTSNLYQNPNAVALAERLCQFAQMDRVFFSNSGAEANEAAIKLARLHGNKKGYTTPAILVAEGAFHGRTLATLTATGNPKVQEGFGPLPAGFVRMPYNDLAAAKAAITAHPEMAAIMVEPIQGEGGIQIPADDYLPGLRALCDEHDLLLILDEIQSGIGRTGQHWAWQHVGAKPDILTSAKALGNGMPIGACMAQGAAAELFAPGHHGSTFGGNPVACVAALAVLETIQTEGLVARAGELGQYLLTELQQRLGNMPGICEIRGRGLMIAIELDRPATEVVNLALKQGLLLNVTAGNVIRLLPPVILDKNEAAEVIERLVATLTEFFK